MNAITEILLSIIIPTRNHAQLVSDLLDTLAAQVEVPFQWEVIVIDNGSTDSTSQLSQEKKSSLPIEIRYIFEPRPGLHNGRHRGALEARGRFLAYLDDDVLLTPNWINGLDKISAGQAEAVVGRILPKWEIRPPRWLVSLIREPGYLSLLDMGTEGHYIDPRFVYGDNFFISKHIVFELNGFHPDGMPADQLRYRGDGEYALMMKFKEAGLRAWYDPGALAYHRISRARMSLDYLFKREYAQGISDSFFEIRSKQNDNANFAINNINDPKLKRKTIRYYLARIKDQTIRELITNITHRIMKVIPLSQANIKARLRKAYWEGYTFHQSEVRKDPKLMEWVLQEDYWDSDP